MSDLRANRRERKQRYLRGLRGEKSAVSPVVATLILILIAVAAAAALYLWLVAWQGSITGGIGTPTAQYTVTLGGSTSAYPFTSLAATQFEQNNSDVVISDNQGGSGAGMLAVCAGNVQVGVSSSLETPALVEANDGCAAEPGITVTTVAYDAVDVIVPYANDHGLISVSWDTMTAIYDAASSTAPSLKAPSIDGVSLTAGVFSTTAPFDTITGGSTTVAWDQIPDAVAGASVEFASGQLGVTSTGTDKCGTGAQSCLDFNVSEAELTDATPFAAAANPGVTFGSAPSGDLNVEGASAYTMSTTSDVATAPGTATSPCGFTLCAGGTTTTVAPATDTIVPVERLEASGTTQAFEARILGASSSTGFATTFTGLSFSGCGGNNLLTDCGMAEPKAEQGNPGVISYVAGNPDSIGYASDGLTRAVTSGVTCQNVATAACGIAVESPGQGAAVQPSLGATGSIAGGIVNGGFGTPGLTTTLTIAQSYSGARPFEFVTLQPPTGEVQRFIEFITQPANNLDLAAETAEVSLYSI